MTDTAVLEADPAESATSRAWATPLAMGALLASAGAGLVHAAAVGTHNSDRTVALIFGATAIVQLGWAGLALLRPRRDVAVMGIIINAVALGAWAISRSRGLPLVDGFATKAEVGTQDLMGAVLAGCAVLGAGVSLVRPKTEKGPNVLAGALVGLVVITLAVAGMAAPHDGDHHGNGAEVAAGAAPADHHGAGAVPADHHGAAAEGETAANAADPSHHDMGAMEDAVPHGAAVAVPYDPTQPIDLGGTPGVTPEQQAEAENLVSVTLVGLPQWADPEYALANGFNTIGDGLTGTEHFVNQEFMNDDVILDPAKPESLVWDVKGGKRTLAAAMFMTKPGVALTDVPDIGGKLVQWHIHTNLCYNGEGLIRGFVDKAGNCPAGLIKPEATPMVHVWIRKHPCGPFAALEGIGGGDILAGEKKLCDEDHGSH